ncbi:glutamine amidotransferase [Corynebacterium sp. MC-04]|uniref:Glutamine amidotransferase n=1 Tax=Corynebacterium parakroppenstedtii TaxID=2828363 RepID=A0ABS9HJW4_9CORY|nr:MULTISPECIES: glutamine amidotransferase [Corynebacterium]KXB51549.1 class I glutamine amidotransferase [Corynebacterium kroppenstedtii]MBY0787683.1 glutamine amidotransferase [Corynebacterium parakroppenstedtii]MBY0791756.1 glutamine amidotransferase [Corynebacterium parakroppenstedtii]MBY0796486.1 glutamine amidotransferase [Corynebacterium parakroppenstedtii]MCF6768707.1 glutamine amidotransferase [Corynebacterium parakroppenstedtii]
MNFVLFSPRHGADVAASELYDFMSASGLQPHELEQRMLDSESAELGDLHGIDGIFVGGSPHTVTNPHKDEEQEHVERLLRALTGTRIPVINICFGAHVLADTHGGTIARLHPEDSGPTQVCLTDAAASDPLCRSLPLTFQAFTGHTENIEILPQDATLLAYGDACPIQIFRIGETQWATQFHAEMDASGLRQRMEFYRNYGYFGVDEFTSIVNATAKVDVSPARQILANFVDFCRSYSRELSQSVA